MTKKRITVVGRGTAGSQAIAHFLRYMSDFEIVWAYDPSTPTQSVGEGSTLNLPRNMYHGLGFYPSDLPKVNGTIKTGIYKENWGTKQESFFHDFPAPQVSYHFSATELQNYIYEEVKGKVNILEESVDVYNADSTFVFNASGTPKTFEDFNISEYIPLNAAYIVQSPWDGPKFNYTLTIARKHGWVFGIPLQNRCSIGYMYNKDISTEEEIQEDIQEILDRYGLTPNKEPNKLEFKNYYRKQNYEAGGSLIHSGNSSFFLEPLEATSIGTMDRIQRAAFDIWSGNKSHHQANGEYLEFLHQIELIIMLHYAAGSPFKTPFWEFAQERGVQKIKDSANDIQFKNTYELVKQIPEMRFAPTPENFPDYGPWWSGAFVQNLTNLGLYPIMDSIFKN